MRNLYVFTAIIWVFTGCALFKDTSKSNLGETRKSAKFTASNKLAVKTANKETNIFTYWSDSGFYQYQNIKEYVGKVETGSLKTEEKQDAKLEQIVRKAEPAKVWRYAGLIILLIGGYLVYKVWFFKRPLSIKRAKCLD